MIPKVIHFIWLGKGKYPKNISKSIESWFIHNSDFKIIKWDESNIPKDLHFVNYMIEKKQWAFASDCLRFWILYNHGGIYLDTDMFVFKNLTPLTENSSLFFGKEADNIISGGIIGSTSKNNLIKTCLNFYLEFNITESKKVIIPEIITKAISENYNISNKDIFEKFENLTIYPSEYFYPISFLDRDKLDLFIPNSQINYAIHLWTASWHNEHENLRYKRYKKAIIIFFKNFISGKVSFFESIIFLKKLLFQIVKNIFIK